MDGMSAARSAQRRWRGAVAAALALAATAWMAPAQAQFFRDAALQRLLDNDRVADLGQAALGRVAAHADDAQAVLGLAVAALSSNQAAHREKALQHAEACLKAVPQAAECHYALGSVLGVHAMSQGMVSMASNVGRVKDALGEAFRLAPQWYPARSALVEFYLLAPGMLGGSTSRAAELARAAPQPLQVRALEARVAMADERFDQAVTLLQQDVPPGADSAVVDDMRQWAGQVGFVWISKGQAAKARGVFERLQRDNPERAEPVFGLARVHAELGAQAEAVQLFEQARKLRGAQYLPIDYRQGIALQAQGQKDAARAMLERAVARGQLQRGQLEDARKRIAQLGGAG